MPTLTADNRLRIEVLKDPNVILITEPGYSDKVIKIVPLPDCVSQFRNEQLKNRVENDERKELLHLQIDLSRGPDQELWREIEREVFMKADRSKPVAKAAQVNNKMGEPWQLAPEEIPTVTLAVAAEIKTEPKTEAKPIENPVKVEEPKIRCGCGKEAKTPTGLKVHQAKCKVR